MGVAVQPHVRCPSCGTTRVVTTRQARRIRAGEHNGLCVVCRGHTKPVSDAELGFWLNRFGAQPPPVMSAREFIVAGGCPPELRDLARAIWPVP